jgi:hypothetical protein
MCNISLPLNKCHEHAHNVAKIPNSRTSLTKSSSKLIHIARDILNIVDISLPPKVVRFSVNNENSSFCGNPSDKTPMHFVQNNSDNNSDTR